MKIYPSQILLTVSVGVLFSHVAIAQAQPSVSPQSKPANTSSVQQDKSLDDKIYKFTREEVERLKKDTKESSELYIRNKVNETMLGYTSLFALVFGSIAGFVLANRWKAEFKKQYLEIIKEEVGEKIKVGVEKEFQDFKNDLKINLNAQRKKDEIMQELSMFIPSADFFVQESIQPKFNKIIQELTHKLEFLQSNNPEIIFTVDDYIKWGDALYHSANYQTLANYPGSNSTQQKAIHIQNEAYNAWFNMLGTQTMSDEYKQILNCYKEAEDKYQYAINNRYEAYNAWLGLGNTSRMLGKYEEAIIRYDKAINIESTLFIAMVNKGLMLKRLISEDEGLEKAIECCTQAITIQPSYYRAWYNRACYHALLGNEKEALDDLNKAISIAPLRCKELAKVDSDLDNIRKHDDYYKLFRQL
jgi:tetratricopeptide (TPR) repeat protein